MYDLISTQTVEAINLAVQISHALKFKISEFGFKTYLGFYQDMSTFQCQMVGKLKLRSNIGVFEVKDFISQKKVHHLL